MCDTYTPAGEPLPTNNRAVGKSIPLSNHIQSLILGAIRLRYFLFPIHIEHVKYCAFCRQSTVGMFWRVARHDWGSYTKFAKFSCFRIMSGSKAYLIVSLFREILL